jgi:hypothetical protein
MLMTEAKAIKPISLADRLAEVRQFSGDLTDFVAEFFHFIRLGIKKLRGTVVWESARRRAEGKRRIRGN